MALRKKPGSVYLTELLKDWCLQKSKKLPTLEVNESVYVSLGRFHFLPTRGLTRSPSEGCRLRRTRIRCSFVTWV